ncbi:hypothetical protein [Duganella dendranthematis]|uniref:hypothetical protein n=1 Tax=Duganella dendranthematis TaxID=2728021 RepID=UPI000D9E29E1|nr:hypothetical protein [Duganella dendranthematis]
MTKTRHRLTAVSDTTPAIAKIACRELSGVIWVSRFPGSVSLSDLAPPFQDYANAFIDALKAAGAVVSIAATYRPLERAYLMHWSWLIAKAGQDPRKVPSTPGVSIQWDHQDDEGEYSSERSIDAAKAMTKAYGIDTLAIAPALISRHTARCAVDMSIRWHGALGILSADGSHVCIAEGPKTGMNRQLHMVGATYGVIKYNQRGQDRPHWSDTGA